MTQYCRYCQNFVCGNGEWCETKQKELTEKYAKRANKCKDFELNPIDAYGENPAGYKPRERSYASRNQIMMEL